MPGNHADDLVLDARDLTVRYGAFTAVDRIRLQARAGEIIGLLGPNGAGKTSVIRALTTIIAICHGTAMVGGHDLHDSRSVRSAIGVLPESSGYPPSQTARSYLTFYAELYGLSSSQARERAERLLRQVGLADRPGRIGTFSRGMRQRLGLARALTNEPVVLFLDEPTLGLDPSGQEEILAHLTRTAVEDGTCVVLCSHLLDEVERVCDRVAVMDHARIVAEGTLEEVVAASGVARSGRVRVQPADLAATDAVLRAAPAVAAHRFDNTRPGDVELEFATGNARIGILRLLLDAGIEPHSFDLQGTRLSDAFLALTRDRREPAP